MTADANEAIDRRTFVKQAGAAMLAAGMDARSYARIRGANDRIRLGQLGCGDRSEGHVHMVSLAAKQMPVETVAVCDLWSLARERRAAQVKKAFHLEPQSYQYSEEVLARKDIDGVMIATGDFQHAKLCIDVVQAGKDCYVEWLSHGSDLVHLWTDESYPHSVVANGGIFTWEDGRENPDTCVAAITYPKGFLYTFKTIFGNSYRSFSRIQGRDGTIDNYGGEGASLFTVSDEGGRKELDPEGDEGPKYTRVPIVAPVEDREEVVRVAGAPAPDSQGPSDDDTGHLVNWLKAMGARTEPNATVDHGFSHALVCIMAAQSYWSGRKLYWDPGKEEISEQPV